MGKMKPSMRSRLRATEQMVTGVNKAGGQLYGELEAKHDMLKKRVAELERRAARIDGTVYRPVRSKVWGWLCGVVRGIV